jgi:hypothetical protein
MENVIVVRFQMHERYTRDIVTRIYDIIHDYCLIEEALGTTRALETLDNLFEQTRILLLQLKAFDESGIDTKHIPYLIASIRYGVLDVFGGVIQPAPSDYKKVTLFVWIGPICKQIAEQRKPQQ